jgi:hypothetical protein
VANSRWRCCSGDSFSGDIFAERDTQHPCKERHRFGKLQSRESEASFQLAQLLLVGFIASFGEAC